MTCKNSSNESVEGHAKIINNNTLFIISFPRVHIAKLIKRSGECKVISGL